MKHSPKIVILFLIFRLLTIPLSAQEDSAADFIEDNPDNVSVICMQGDETIVSHNADERLTLASTAKTIILAEYARQVALGTLNPDEEVSLETLESYYIPLTDGNAHLQWQLTLETGAESATLSQIADGMIIYSSNANADYLLSRLDPEGFVELYDLLELENTDYPTYFLGNLLVLSNHETGIRDLEAIEALDEETFLAEHDRLVDLFVNDVDWREAELAFRQNEQVGLPDISLQAAYFDSFTVQSTAEDMLKVIQAAYIGDVLSDEAQAVMQDHLDWLFDVNPANADVFEAIGTKGGAYAGIFTVVWYVAPINGEAISLVVLYHDLPDDVWVEWLSSYAFQQLEIAAISTPAGCDVFADILPEG